MLIGSHHRQVYMGRVTMRGGGLFVHTSKNNLGQTGRANNRLVGEGLSNSAVPVGYLAPDALYLPYKTGVIGATRGAVGTGSLSGIGAMGVNLTADMTGEGTLTGDITYILFVNASADLVGAGVLQADGTYLAFVLATADLSGSGTLDASLNASKNAVASLSGSGAFVAEGYVTHDIASDITSSGSLAAVLKGLGELVAEVVSAGALTATPKADGKMSATIQFQSEAVTPQSVAQAVWESVAANYTNMDTFGGQANFLYLLAHNKTITDPIAGTMTIYDTDGVTPLYVADLYENTAGTQTYRGQGADRRDEFA